MFITEHYFRCAGRWSLLPLDIARLLTNQLLTVASHLSYRRREWYLDFNLGKKETKHISQNVKTSFDISFARIWSEALKFTHRRPTKPRSVHSRNMMGKEHKADFL